MFEELERTGKKNPPIPSQARRNHKMKTKILKVLFDNFHIPAALSINVGILLNNIYMEDLCCIWKK